MANLHQTGLPAAPWRQLRCAKNMSVLLSGRLVDRPLWSARNRFGEVFVARSFRQIDPVMWRRASRQHAKDSRFHEVVEQTLNDQFEQRYFVLENEDTGAVVIQPFFIVRQDIGAGLPLPVKQFVARLRRNWPEFFYMNILMVGSPAAEGHLDSVEPWAVQSLKECVECYARLERVGLVLLKDFPEEYREVLAAFSNYRRIPGLPATALKLDFATFEEYMAERLSKVYRKSLRRKFRALDQQIPLRLEVFSEPVPGLTKELFELYWEVYQRAKLSFEVLNRRYLETLWRTMPDKIRVFTWRQNGRLIAFNLCLVHEGILDDLYVGFDYDLAHELNLYFVTWRDVINWCLDNGIKSYRSGPLSYDPKLHLKMQLVPQDLYARHLSPLLNGPLLLAMSVLGPVRYEPILQLFPNAGDL